MVQNCAFNKAQFIIHIPSRVALGNSQLAAQYTVLNECLLGTHLVSQKVHYRVSNSQYLNRVLL
jgi:hypothetical protein